MRSNPQNKAKSGGPGFSLIELMIVVSIIGVLATIGIPLFKSYLLKAKMGEAKVMLGAIYTAEKAFYAEHEAYGNRLDMIGIDTSKPATGLIYSTGFPISSGCVQATEPLPDKLVTPQGRKLLIESPPYYDETAVISVLVRKDSSGNQQGRCQSFGFPDDGAFFTATSTGAIKPGVDFLQNTTVGGPGNPWDVWTINQDGVLSHLTDGSK